VATGSRRGGEVGVSRHRIGAINNGIRAVYLTASRDIAMIAGQATTDFEKVMSEQ